MGTLDMFHSQVSPGPVFVWLHSVATFIGGFFAMLIWLPESISKRFFNRYYLGLILILSVGFSISSMLWPELIFPMLDKEKQFTFGAKFLNVTGGIEFLIAWMYFAREFHRKHQSQLFYFSNHFALFGIAGLLFEISILWDGNWWFWHMMRAFAYVLLMFHFSSIYRGYLLSKIEQSAESLNISQQRLLLHREQSPVGVIEWNTDFEFLDWNPAAERIFGFTKDEVTGAHITDRILPESARAAVDKVWAELLENKGGFYSLNENTTKDGRTILCEWHNTPLADHEGKVIGLTSLVDDVTEREKDKEVLRITQQRLLLHREQSPVGVIEWNTDFEFLYWNPAAEKIFGFTKEEVEGHHITERILPESARAAVDKLWAELLENKGGLYSLNENTTKDGRTILCEWHNTPLVDQDGKVIGVTSLVDDVTERQNNEETLRHSQKMDAIGNLTGGIAHDFNNTLSVILGFSQLLKQRVGDGDPKLVKYGNEIFNTGERAKKLTSKLLEFSRKAPSSEEATDVNELLYGMQHLLEKTLTARITLTLELENNLWPVWLDKARLEDAILNISINSMHAMQDGGTLTLSASNTHLADIDVQNLNIPAGDYVLLVTSDTGIGMTHEVKQKIFDPFFTTKGDEGTGLGMSQVYGFIQRSDGHIQVFSEPGHGTRITIYIPRYQKSGAIKPKATSTNPVKLPSGYETILVVDDEVGLLDLTEEYLTTYGYTVLRAVSAEQALEILKNNPVDLMLSDVIMPGMDGYQLATEAERRYPKLKIQMASGFSEKQKVNLVNEKLYEQRLQKPYSVETLLKTIRELLDE